MSDAANKSPLPSQQDPSEDTNSEHLEQTKSDGPPTVNSTPQEEKPDSSEENRESTPKREEKNESASPTDDSDKNTQDESLPETQKPSIDSNESGTKSDPDQAQPNTGKAEEETECEKHHSSCEEDQSNPSDHYSCSDQNDNSLGNQDSESHDSHGSLSLQSNESISNSISKKSYKAVKIWENSSGRYKVRREDLKKILSQDGVADKQIALYSIAGESRLGKSFLLNLILHHLHQKQSKDCNGSEIATLDDGFKWRGGKDLCTEGIWIWNEPFHVNDNTVVFLMDTQGTTYRESSVKGCTSAFALSTLISSLQIFNIERQIQERDIELLEIFTECGRKAGKLSRQPRSNLFQRLLFLIRDWHDPAACPYGFQGGEKVISDALQIHSNSAEMKSVRKNIHSTFDEVQCFLMPQPGDAVEIRASSDSSNISFSDINRTFLKQVKDLADALFREPIPVKRINGKPITASSLVDVITAYGEICEVGEIPKTSTILEATARTAMLTTIQACVEDYVCQMKQTCKDGYIEAENLQQIHEGSKQEILQKFDNIPKLRKHNYIVTYRGQLACLLEEHFKAFETLNDAYKKEIDNKIKVVIEEAEEAFIEVMEKVCQNALLESNNFEHWKNCATEEANNIFRKCDYIQVANDYSECDMGIKISKLTKRYEATWNASKQHAEANVLLKLAKAKEEYIAFMEQYCTGPYTEGDYVQKIHNHAVIEVIKNCDEAIMMSSTGMHTPFYEQHKAVLSASLETMKLFYEAKNHNHEILLDIKAANLLQKAKEGFEEFMKQKCESGYVPSEFITQAMDEAGKYVQGIIGETEKQFQITFCDTYKESLQQFIHQKELELQAKNNDLKKEIESDLMTKTNEMKATYKKSMDMTCKAKYLLPTDLQAFHGKVLVAILKQFDSLNFSMVASLFEDKRRMLVVEINLLKALYEKNNERVKADLEQSLKSAISTATDLYNRIMAEKCVGKYLPLDDFTQVHKQAHSQGLTRFESQDFRALASTLNEAKQAYLKATSDLYCSYEKANDIYLRFDQAQNKAAVLKTKNTFNNLMTQLFDSQYDHDSDLRQIEQESLNLMQQCSVENDKNTDRNFTIAIERRLNELKDRSAPLLKMKVALKNAKETYNDFMKKECKGGLCNATQFQTIHDKALEKASKIYQNGFGNGAISEKIKSVITEQREMFEWFNTKVLANARCKAALYQAKNTYIDCMTNLCDGKYLEEDDFLSKHDEASSQTFARFHQSVSDIESNRVKKADESELLNAIKQMRNKFRQRNNINQKVQTAIQDDMAKQAKEIYKGIMNKKVLDEGYVATPYLQATHNEVMEFVWERIGAENERSGINFSDDYKIKIKTAFRRRFQKISEENERLKNKLEQELSQTLERSKQTYTGHMNAKCNSKYMESGIFKKTHSEAKTKARDNFALGNFEKLPSSRDAAKRNLEIAIEYLKAEYETKNEVMRVDLENEISSNVSSAKSLYTSSMNEICSRGYSSLPELEKHHKRNKKLVEEFLRGVEQRHGRTFADICSSQLITTVEELWIEIKAKNEQLKNDELERLEANVDLALNTYKDSMEEHTREYMNEALLAKIHDDERSRAMQSCDFNVDNSPHVECKKILLKFKKNLQAQWRQYRKKNDENKKRTEEKCKQNVKDAEDRYLRGMREICSVNFVESHVLVAIHQQIKPLIMDSFSEETTLSSRHQPELNLESSFDIIKKENDKKKK